MGLAFMIRNRPSLKYFYSANSYGPDVGTHCPHLTLLYHDEHFQDYLFNLTESSSYEDIFISKEIPALIWNKTSSVWFERINHQNITNLSDFKTPVCGNWENNSVVAPDIFLWFILNCLPSITQHHLCQLPGDHVGVLLVRPGHLGHYTGLSQLSQVTQALDQPHPHLVPLVLHAVCAGDLSPEHSEQGGRGASECRGPRRRGKVTAGNEDKAKAKK